jgi:N-acetylglutamate synthase-like GNAT family acetyltransferase
MANDQPPIDLRRATIADVPRMVELIAGANLPPLFVVEHIDGFVVAERGEAVVGCGGIELFGRCAVIRSVVVDEAWRGTGLGKRLYDALMAIAVPGSISDVYLFTADARDFWQHLGFREITFEDWKPEARMNWQYQFLSQNRDLVPEVMTMWRPS